MLKRQGKRGKGKKGILGKCPKCKYMQRLRTKSKNPCCSNCTRKSPRNKWLRK